MDSWTKCAALLHIAGLDVKAQGSYVPGRDWEGDNQFFFSFFANWVGSGHLIKTWINYEMHHWEHHKYYQGLTTEIKYNYLAYLKYPQAQKWF